MKKGITVLLIVSMLMFILSPCAFAAELGDEYVFVCDDGTEIYYYLDENDMPFDYKNGEKRYLLLPLERFIVNDAEKLAELGSVETEEDGVMLFSEPTSYYSLMLNSPTIASNVYTQFMTFETGSVKMTTNLRKYSNHIGIHIQTANLGKQHSYNSKKVYAAVYCYEGDDIGWMRYDLHLIDGTPAIGCYRQLQAGGISYIKIEITKNNSNVIWFDLNVWTTAT